jgi:cell shape-determining protein MreD
MNWLHSIFILAVAFVAVFLEAAFNLPRHLFGAQIDLLPALMVYTALTNGFATITLLAVLGGLWFDSLSLNPLGASVLPLLVIGVAIYRSRDLLLREHTFAQVVLGGSAAAFQPLGTLFVLLNVGAAPLLGWFSLWQWLVMALAGGIMTPLCFALFDRLHHAFDYPRAPQATFRADREIKRGRM